MVASGTAAPYVGGRPFLAADSAFFFGRAAQATALAARWRGSRLTILTSPSGTGRTSLLQAGVMPLLAREGSDVLPVGRVYRGTAFPVAALAEHNPHTLALLAHWSPGEPETQLSGLTVHDFLRKRPAKYDGHGRPVPVLAAIDQVEDLFAVAADRNTAAFVGELAEALVELPQLRLLLSVPDDYLPALAAQLGHLPGSLPEMPDFFPLPPLSEADALDAARLPSAAAGRSLGPGAARALVMAVRDAAEPGQHTGAAAAGDGPPGVTVDPWLLQVACTGLWDALPVDVTDISERHVACYSLGRALEGACASVVATAAAVQRMPAADLAAWLPEAFLDGEAGGYRRRLVAEGGTRTAGMPNAVLRRLRSAHLLAAVWRDGARWYALRHDLLAGPVARLVRWAPRDLDARFAGTPSAFLSAAETAMADGDLELAQQHGEAALRGARGSDLRLCGAAESLLGNAAYLRGDLEHAEERYRGATESFEAMGDTRAVAGLLAAVGKSLLAQGRHAAAIEHLHSAVGRIPNDLTVQTELAWALWQAGQQRAALDVLTSILAIDGGAADALRARGEILADMGDAAGALRDLARLRQPESPSTLAAHGLALTMLTVAGQENDATRKIDAALSQAPDSGPVLVYAARAAALGQHPEVAADLARRAVNATDPVIPEHQRRQALDLIEGKG